MKANINNSTPPYLRKSEKITLRWMACVLTLL